MTTSIHTTMNFTNLQAGADVAALAKLAHDLRAPFRTENGQHSGAMEVRQGGLTKYEKGTPVTHVVVEIGGTDPAETLAKIVSMVARGSGYSVSELLGRVKEHTDALATGPGPTA